MFIELNDGQDEKTSFPIYVKAGGRTTLERAEQSLNVSCSREFRPVGNVALVKLVQ
jgi:hypothetical protein